MTKRYEYHKLRSCIFNKGYTLMEVAKVLGISNVTLGQRMDGKSAFNLDEIYKLLSLLEIPVTDMHIFFPNRAENKNIYLK